MWLCFPLPGDGEPKGPCATSVAPAAIPAQQVADTEVLLVPFGYPSWDVIFQEGSDQV